MKLIDLWKLGDASPFKMFINCGSSRKEVLDGPGFPVVDGRNASDLEVKSMRPASYSMYGSILEIILEPDAESVPPVRRFPFYGVLAYLDPAEYLSEDVWQYESTEQSFDGTTWDIVSRTDSPVYDCRYTEIGS